MPSCKQHQLFFSVDHPRSQNSTPSPQSNRFASEDSVVFVMVVVVVVEVLVVVTRDVVVIVVVWSQARPVFSQHHFCRSLDQSNSQVSKSVVQSYGGEVDVVVVVTQPLPECVQHHRHFATDQRSSHSS